ncbi:UPF0280 family protein [bacterium]|nr:UPF0280 family protein [bacterium]
MKGEIRTYRSLHNIERFRFFNATVFESDLHIGVDNASFDHSLIEFVTCEIQRTREILNEYNILNSTFFSSLTPLPLDDSAETEISSMLKAGIIASVGPMAAVAGLTSETVGKRVLENFPIKEIVVENGGDIWASVKETLFVEILAGNSPLSGKLALKIPHGKTPLGICTSSGTVGHSLSFGKADAVVICAHDASIADAFATAVCNIVKTESDIDKALEFTSQFKEILSTVIVINDKIAVSGEFEIVALLTPRAF